MIQKQTVTSGTLFSIWRRRAATSAVFVMRPTVGRRSCHPPDYMSAYLFEAARACSISVAVAARPVPGNCSPGTT